MSNGLTLPFKGNLVADLKKAFEIDTGSGSTAIVGQSNGPSFTGGFVAGGGVMPVGVEGQSDVGIGVMGICGADLAIAAAGIGGIGVLGTSQTGDAVRAISTSNQHAAVSAENDCGGSQTAFGVWARGTPGGHFESTGGIGIQGVSQQGDGVDGLSHAPHAAGVSGTNDGGGGGVAGSSNGGNGVSGFTNSDITNSPVTAGVSGSNAGRAYGVLGKGGVGVRGEGNDAAGVHGVFTSESEGFGVLGEGGTNGTGVAGMSNKGNGVFGSSVSGLAGAFNGKVSVLGDIIITGKIHNAQAHRLIVEKDKEAKERGYYIHPELYAQPDERDVRWVQNSG